MAEVNLFTPVWLPGVMKTGVNKFTPATLRILDLKRSWGQANQSKSPKPFDGGLAGSSERKGTDLAGFSSRTIA